MIFYFLATVMIDLEVNILKSQKFRKIYLFGVFT
jgi:hypothetical protein